MIVIVLHGGPDASIKGVNAQLVPMITSVLLGVTDASMENANVTFIGYETDIFSIILR